MRYFYEFDENIYALSQIQTFLRHHPVQLSNIWYNAKIVL